jgi:hypothetical protein
VSGRDCRVRSVSSMSALPPPRPPSVPPPLSSAPPHAGWPRDRIGGVIAAGVIVVAALLPWASVQTVFGTISKNGIEGDGAVTAVFGAVIGGMFVMQRRGGYAAAIVLAGLTIAISGYDLIDVNRLGDDGEGLASISAGIGLYLTLLGGLAAMFCAISERRRVPS